MSYATVKSIWPGEKHEDFEELRNSHGSAPVIWNAMAKKYLGTDDYGWMIGSTMTKLWPLYKDDKIPECHRAVLMMTYDRAYVTKKNYHRAKSDIEKFMEDFEFNPKHVNHWPRIAEIYGMDPGVPAIGLYCTSVSEDPFKGEWNEEKEDYDDIDWSTCYDMYSELDKLKE